MITANDLKGIMAMMPAFTTKDGDRPDAEDTVNTAELTRAVDQIIRDGGANVITTTGSFGEFHTLLWEEHKKLIEATVAAVKKRVPVFIGCTNLNPREAIRQARFAQEAGADGVLLGVPFYYQATVDNAVQFYHDVADALPKMGVMIYHNPTHHRVMIPVGAFKKITQKPNIVGMKDSHRTPLQFVELMNSVKGKISVFVNQNQAFPMRCSALQDVGPSTFGWDRRRSSRCAKPVRRLTGKRQNRSVSIWMVSARSDRILATSPGAKTFSNFPSTKPDIAPRDRCALPGALCRKRSSTTAKKSLPIGNLCAKNIRQRDWRRARKKHSVSVSSSGFRVNRKLRTFGCSGDLSD
jgi:hypothetical protein